jgi:N-methylhydantoinase B
LHGGKPGAVNECYIHRADGTETAVKKATEVEIAAGDVVRFLTAGGGGYGDPKERAAEAIEHDIAAGVVTKKKG